MNTSINPLAAQRKARLAEALSGNALDAIVLFGNAWQGDYLRYATDFASCEGDALAIASADGSISLFVEVESEAERAAVECESVNVVVARDPAAAVRHALEKQFGSRGVAFAPAGLIPVGLMPALEQRGAVDGTALMDALLIAKSALERDAITRAAALADLGYETFRRAAQIGRAEYEIVAEVEALLRAKGCPDNFMLVGSGGIEMRGMHPASERRLIAGDLVTTELTPCVDGYYAQLCRTLVIGEPSPAQLGAFDVFREAVIEGRRQVRPGVTASAVAKAQNDVFRAKGLGEYCTSEYTRVRGHGLGLFPDSKPHILEGVDTILPEGAALIVHPNTYHPEVGYIVLGDTLLVTKDGHENLAATPLELLRNSPL
jgi:Xaa-Pro aminopeptidase